MRWRRVAKIRFVRGGSRATRSALTGPSGRRSAARARVRWHGTVTRHGGRVRVHAAKVDDMTTDIARDLVLDAFSRIRDGLPEVVDGLSVDELLWRPDADANHIAWLVWHLA